MFETEDAIRNGADEIDMVVNLGLVKDGDWEGVVAEGGFCNMGDIPPKKSVPPGTRL